MKQYFRKHIRLVVVITILSIGIFVSPYVMTMQMTPREVQEFFAQQDIPYHAQVSDIGGHSIHYLQTGKRNNPVLVFIHGSPGSWDAFGEYMKDPDLLQRYRMVSLDRVGFGASEFGNPVDLQTNIHVVVELLAREFPNTPVVLVGHSLGAAVAAGVAAQMPESVAQLVLLSGSLDPTAEKPELWRLLLLYPPLRWVTPGAMRPSNYELWVFKEGLNSLRPELQKITASTTVIHGTVDKLVPYSNAEYVKRELVKVRSMRIIPIKDAGHFIPWEHYSEVKDVLLGN